ncbi:MAG: ABC transporter permease [Planctomycetes bacterium]|nr:ABC transporter permease [Planctomycetota bacterium]
MKKLLFLAVKDMRVLLSDKGNVFWVFGFPVLFALFFGFMYSEADKGPSGMKIAVVDEDKSEFSGSFISGLESDEALVLVHLEREKAIEQVRKGKVSAAVVLKEGFGEGIEALFNSSEPKLEIASDPSRRITSGYLQGLLVKAQFKALSGKFADQDWLRGQIKQWRDGVEGANALETGQSKLFLNFFDSFDTLIKDSNDGSFGGGFEGDMINFGKLDVSREYEGPIAPFQIIFPQVLIWGFLMCTSTFAVSIVKERTDGTFNRMRIGPLGYAHILGGKGLACFMTCICIMCILFLGAKGIFKMPMGNYPLFIMGLFFTILCFVGLMMFVCTIGRTEQSVGAAGWAILMIMGMFGGAMLPLAFMPSWLQRVSHVSPVKWGILALEGAIWRDFKFTEMISPCLVLLAIGFTFFLLGVWILRRQDS